MSTPTRNNSKTSKVISRLIAFAAFVFIGPSKVRSHSLAPARVRKNSGNQ